MSRVNKVNPGKYTQRGRLTQDDAAREMAKQREAGSPKRMEGGQFGENVKSRVKEKDDEEDEEQPRAAAKQAKTSRTTTARQAKTSR